MFEIETDRAAGIIRIAVKGFWTMDTIAAFVRALSAEAAAVSAGGRRPALFYDFSDAVIQSQEIVAAFQEVARRAPASARRVALYTEGAMAMGQARRVAEAGAGIRVFQDEREAINWLAAA